MSTRHTLSVSLYRSVKKRLRSQGYTMVEMMVVVALIGFLSAISVSLISLLFQSNIRAAQSANQQNNIESFYGFLASKLSYVGQGDMGVRVGDTVLARSLAPDQMLFTFTDEATVQETCYRLLYLREKQEIRVASTTGSCTTSNLLLPKRFPNEAPNSSGSNSSLVTDDGFAKPDHPDFDPAIDSAAGEWASWVSSGQVTSDEEDAASFPLVAGIRDGSGYNNSDGDSGNDWPRSYPEKYRDPGNVDLSAEFLAGRISIFSYWKGAGQPLPPATAGAIDTGGLTFVRVQSFSSAAPSPTESAIIPDRFYEQRFFIDQLCSLAPTTGGSSEPTLENLPPPPGVALRFSGDGAVDFNSSGALLFENEEFFDPGEASQISVAKTGIYTLSANACYSADEGNFQIKRGSETILSSGARFAGQPDTPGLETDERCLSASRTLRLAKDDILTMQTSAQASGDISLIWEGQDG